MLPFLTEYDALVFTMEGFVPPALKHQRLLHCAGHRPPEPQEHGAPQGIGQEIRAWRGIDPGALLNPGVPLRPLERPPGRD